ncbi:hypothetical protein OG777_21010 [Micromonospora peucetia]|uniref:Uncharacterized protein n=1 Tax=Micromonospora peucetia TaxID=47871 RepID=A0A1C6V8R5_9ACTN|nr:hypothetical protein [Micromonospora peucetia]MCX4389390.1 hypothetical protein [Micromonospora peucetia]WSA29887.1 hypothetical protein OIE14_16760 [Micromonospora peucetia]SCL62655.1 hypothetical protein GA0070608_2675 [Micromonospora peucetia]
MSRRKLGRLLGSLFALAALASGVLVGDLQGLGDLQTADVIWNMPAPR